MTTFVSDTFGGSGILSGRAADVGGTWAQYTLQSGWTTGSATVFSGEDKVTFDGNPSIFRNPTNAGTLFGQYDATCQSASTSNGIMTIYGRVNASAATYYVAGFTANFGTPSVYVERYDAGTLNGISPARVAFDLGTTSHTLSLKMEDLGGGTHRISVLVDGVSKASFDDASPLTDLAAGIGGRSSYFLDFVAADTTVAGAVLTGPSGAVMTGAAGQVNAFSAAAWRSL